MSAPTAVTKNILVEFTPLSLNWGDVFGDDFVAEVRIERLNPSAAFTFFLDKNMALMSWPEMLLRHGGEEATEFLATLSNHERGRIRRFCKQEYVKSRLLG